MVDITYTSNPMKFPPGPWRKGWALPSRLECRVDDEEAPYVVEFELVLRDRQMECSAARFLQRPGGPPVQPARLRDVPLGAYVRSAITENAMSVEETAPGSYRLTPARQEDLAEVFAETEGRRRWRITDELLREVTKVYMAAAQEGRPPRKAVENEGPWAPVAPNTAARWIRAARDRGFLDADPPPPAGRTSSRKGR